MFQEKDKCLYQTAIQIIIIVIIMIGRNIKSFCIYPRYCDCETDVLGKLDLFRKDIRINLILRTYTGSKSSAYE